MMAIVSKAVFEKESPGARVGDVLPIDVYRSTHKAFERLDAKSRLFLVTVRPPDERLWLLAVLEGLAFDGKQWNAKKNARAVTDITHLRAALTFESGKGLTAAKGQLGMSLQTPRGLTANDVEALLTAAGAPATQPAPATKGPPNLTAHDPSGVLPCLCRQCLPRAPERASARGMDFVRAHSEAKGKVLHFWVPVELEGSLSAITQSVKGSLLARASKRK